MVAPQTLYLWAKVWIAAVWEPSLVHRIQAALHHPETNKVPGAHCLPMMLPPAGANHVTTQVQILPTAHLRCKVLATAQLLHSAHPTMPLPVRHLHPASARHTPTVHLLAQVPRPATVQNLLIARLQWQVQAAAKHLHLAHLPTIKLTVRPLHPT